MTNITCSLCFLQIPFMDAYVAMDPRGMLKHGHAGVTKLLKCRYIFRCYSFPLWYFFLKAEKRAKVM